MKKTLIFILMLSLLAACTANTTETPVVPDDTTQSGTYQASAFLSKELIYTLKEGVEFGQNYRDAFLAAISRNHQEFLVDGSDYYFEKFTNEGYRIYGLTPVAEVFLDEVTTVGTALMSDEFRSVIQDVLEKDIQTFEYAGKKYVVSQTKKITQISVAQDAALASLAFIEAYDPNFNETISKFDFRLKLEIALELEANGFKYEGDDYGIVNVPGGHSILDSENNLLAEMSDIYVIPPNLADKLPLAFKNMVRDAIVDSKESFVYRDSSGKETKYLLVKNENNWSIKAEEG
ncbi:MAG: hypothetical protein GX666_13730 [Tissierellia bacterium]|nr:hypothetical protein [Tissierellia bacterium]